MSGKDFTAAQRENEELSEVDSRLDNIIANELAPMFADEIATMLRAGFDCVCLMNSKGQASDLLMACCVQGVAKRFSIETTEQVVLISSSGIVTYS